MHKTYTKQKGGQIVLLFLFKKINKNEKRKR